MNILKNIQHLKYGGPADIFVKVKSIEELKFLLGLAKEKNVKTGEIEIKSLVQLMTLYQCQLPGFDAVLSLDKMLPFGKAGWTVDGNCVSYFGSFYSCESKKVFKRP